MRRCAVTKPRPRRALRWLAALLAFAWAFFALGWYVEERCEPVLNELAEYEARAAVAKALNETVTAALAADPQLCAGLYQVQYSGGEPVAVQADTAAMNAARLTLVAAVNGALQALPEVRMTVPFGTLSDISLLNGLGPGWPLTFRPEAFAEGEVLESAETVAINAVRYTAALRLRVTINMVLDGKNRMLYIESLVPLASVTVNGETPRVYAAG